MIGALIKGAIVKSFVQNVGEGGKGIALDTADFPKAETVDYTPFLIMALVFMGATVFLITKN